MKQILKIIILLFVVNSTNAQSNQYYYYKGNKIYLTLDKSKLCMFVDSTFNKTQINQLNFKNFDLQEYATSSSITQKFSKLEFIDMPTDIEYYQTINSLKNTTGVNFVQPCFLTSEGREVTMSSYFQIKLKNSYDVNKLNELAVLKNVEIIKQNDYMPLWYLLKCKKNSIGNTLEIANFFFETDNFVAAVPDFIEDNMLNEEIVSVQMINNIVTPPVGCSNDPNFDKQWNLNNTGQYDPFQPWENGHPHYGTPGVDIKACNAWQITRGSNINVAVFDTGGESTNTELINNLLPLSYNIFTGSNSVPDHYHGAIVAGIIGAERNNSQYGSGVAPESKIMIIGSILYGHVFYANGINWAWQNGADVINNSWGFYTLDQSIDDAFQNAMTLGRNGLGTIVVAASGNTTTTTPGTTVAFPANIPEVISVGGIYNRGERAEYSRYGSELDVVAPCNPVYALYNNAYTSMSGTSSAAPHVSGVAALILSVNPCLTVQQVRNVIEQTAQKVGGYSYTTTSDRPNGTWNNEMGYGLVDAYAAVQMAQSMLSSSLDLMVKDGTDDIGNEPNNITPYMWASTDIWVRNQNDGITNQVHQNPEYSPTTPNYAYVRVTNKSCVASTGNEVLHFYWAKAGSSLSWPDTWDGNHYFPVPNNTKKMGAPVGQATIPVLQPGQETIVTIPFLVPNPADYAFAGSDQWHFCLLARIESANDPLTETNDLYANVQNNNGIAWKNVTIVDVQANITHGTIAVGNPFNTPRTFYLELVKEDLETGKAIYEEAEVGVKMDEVLYQAWERGGKEAQQLDATDDEKKKIVKGNNVIVDNITFNANEMGFLTLDFSFLTKETTEKQKFKYHVIQRDAQTGNIIGGETYEIKKKERPAFDAEAPDKEADLNQAITISASDINEPAVYNWYDSQGNLVYQGKELQIANAIAEKYKLEVIATTDGFKDYKEVEVTLKPSSLGSITPNPASTTAQVQYKLNGAGSAYLMVLGYYGSTGISNNYILDNNSTETTLNISNYPTGFYTIALVVNGEIIDAKTLIKQ